ncbi:MAG: hypothetical protein ACKVOE_01015 [Rickettsiales bacterium]
MTTEDRNLYVDFGAYQNQNDGNSGRFGKLQAFQPRLEFFTQNREVRDALNGYLESKGFEKVPRYMDHDAPNQFFEGSAAAIWVNLETDMVADFVAALPEALSVKLMDRKVIQQIIDEKPNVRDFHAETIDRPAFIADEIAARAKEVLSTAKRKSVGRV